MSVYMTRQPYSLSGARGLGLSISARGNFRTSLSTPTVSPATFRNPIVGTAQPPQTASSPPTFFQRVPLAHREPVPVVKKAPGPGFGARLAERAKTDPVLWVKLAAEAGNMKAESLRRQYERGVINLETLKMEVRNLKVGQRLVQRIKTDPAFRSRFEGALTAKWQADVAAGKASPVDYPPVADIQSAPPSEEFVPPASEVVDMAMDQGDRVVNPNLLPAAVTEPAQRVAATLDEWLEPVGDAIPTPAEAESWVKRNQTWLFAAGGALLLLAVVR